MLKISQAEEANQSVTLKLEGRVVGPWVGELHQVCDAVLKEGHTIQLDLAEVTYADIDGVAVLSSFKSRGVRFRNCSPFVKQQLKSAIKMA
jgi:ABC-type transporter Mla MlaB component